MNEVWNSILSSAVGVILASFLAYFVHKRKVNLLEKKEKQAAEKVIKQERLSFYRLMAVNLHANHDAFIEQCKIRNRLLRSLGHDLNSFNWDDLEGTFSKAYQNFDDKQRTLFDFIRGITEGPLFGRNIELLNLLKKNPKYFNELEEFESLQAHLDLWIVKFDAIFKKREDYCLVYVGVEEKKPFPKEIDPKVAQEIAKMEAET